MKKKVLFILFIQLFFAFFSVYGAGQELSLVEAVDTALQNNLGLQLRKEDVNAAKGALLIERGAFDTLFTAGASTGKKELSPLAKGALNEERKSAWQLGAEKKFSTGTNVTISWGNSRYSSTPKNPAFDPVLRSGLNITVQQPFLKGLGQKRQRAGQNAAEKSAQAMDFTVENEAVNLAANVKKAYWNLAFTRENLKTGKLSLELAEQLFTKTRAQISAGRRARIDIYQPEAEIALRKQELIAAKKAIGEAEDTLKLLMGVQSEARWHVEFKPIDFPKTELPQQDSAEIFKVAMKNRPDIQAVRKQIEAAEYGVIQSQDQLRPSLDLIGNYGISATDDSYGTTMSKSIDEPQKNWSLGVQFSMPFHNDSAKGALAQAHAQKIQRQITLQSLKQQLQLEVRTALRDALLAIETLNAAKKTIIASQKQLEAEQAKFEVGRATTFDVLSAQQRYSTARSQHALSQANCAIASAELERVQGYIFVGDDRKWHSQ